MLWAPLKTQNSGDPRFDRLVWGGTKVPLNLWIFEQLAAWWKFKFIGKFPVLSSPALVDLVLLYPCGCCHRCQVGQMWAKSLVLWKELCGALIQRIRVPRDDLYPTCLPSLTNLYGKHDLTAIFILEVPCARLPCNESWLNWVRNSRLITLLAPVPQHRGFCTAEGEEAAEHPGHPQIPLSPFPFPGSFSQARAVEGSGALGTSGALPGTFVWSCVAWQCMSKCSVFAFFI